MLAQILPALRAAAKPASYAVVAALKPLKIYAYKTQFNFLKRLILELTTPIDTALVVLNVQNETMKIHQRVYGGNFVFGKGVMITNHAQTAAEITKPAMRCNHFMGIDIVTSDTSVFATNAPSLNQSPPVRAVTRKYMDEHIFDKAKNLDYDAVHAQTEDILEQWKAARNMATYLGIRGAATRIFLKILSGVDVPKDEVDDVTAEYYSRFAQVMLLNYYAPPLLGFLGARESLRRDVYLKLKDRGIDLLTIEVTLFAGMFSVGTNVMQAILDIQRFKIDYPGLPLEKRRRFVIEAQRLSPTVTSTHRVLEKEEMIRVAGHDLRLKAGDEVVYPFVCPNRDPARFQSPDEMKLDRPQEEVDEVLSWSRGPHACPAKELSVLVTMVMLDTLAERHDLSKLQIFNPVI